MTIHLVQTICSSDFTPGFQFAAIDFTKELLAKIIDRKRTFMLTKTSDSDLEIVTYRDYHCQYFSSGIDDLLEEGFVDTNCALPFGKSLPENKIERIENSNMIFTACGVFWECHPRHADNEVVFTKEISYEFLANEFL